MFTKIRNSWNLAKASAAVLQADKELLVFPIISAIMSFSLVLLFILPVLGSSLVGGVLGLSILNMLVFFCFYVLQYFVVFFCNTALIGAAIMRLSGQDPTVKDGFRIAFQHIRSILGYALIASTVGIILNWLSEKAGFLGQIAVSFVGLAWNLATFLVVPVLVMEEVGPIDAIKRSTQLLKQTWGEQIAGNLSINFIFGLTAVFVSLVAVPLLILLGIAQQYIPLAILGGTFLLVLVTLHLVSTTLSSIYTAAVYQYAIEKKAGTFFDANLIQDTFKAKSA